MIKRRLQQVSLTLDNTTRGRMHTGNNFFKFFFNIAFLSYEGTKQNVY